MSNITNSRLRYKEYLKIYATHNIPIIDTKIWDYDATLLNGLKLNQKFSNYTKEELAIVHVYIVSSK
ncbi:MAG: hypothetical protein IPK18_06805 [Sphingobacteriales bacterium]|jgi:hypothetical protein|nr:MAG: hypothetical protein IPK18_06805 [Sphingobacteriales bacterium]